MVSLVVAMNRVDVVDLVVDLVDVDLEVDLVWLFWLDFTFLPPSCSGGNFARLYLGHPCRLVKRSLLAHKSIREFTRCY